jgi:hypothetical protein
MFEGVIFNFSSIFFDSLIKIVGALSFILGLLLVCLSHYRIKPCVPLNRTIYRVFKALGRTEAVLVMVTTALYFIASLAISGNLFYLSGLWLLIICSVIGTLFSLAFGRKGIGIPLGYGVVVTIDKSPKLKFPLSKRVLSFHVNRKFLKYQEEALARIAETILLINDRYDSHDAIFLSWIFANKANIRKNHEEFYKKVRFYLLAANAFVLVVPAGYILALLIWASDIYTKKFDGSHSAILAVMGIACVCLIASIYCVASVRNQAKILLCANDAIAISHRVKNVAEGLNLPNVRFGRKDIKHRPMPLVHLAFLSITRKVMRSAVGIESGFVLIGKKKN